MRNHLFFRHSCSILDPPFVLCCIFGEPTLFFRYGEVDDVESILSGGVDANHKDAHGNTALHLSCANGHADVVRALIKGGASHLPNGAGNRYIRISYVLLLCSQLMLLVPDSLLMVH